MGNVTPPGHSKSAERYIAYCEDKLYQGRVGNNKKVKEYVDDV